MMQYKYYRKRPSYKKQILAFFCFFSAGVIVAIAAFYFHDEKLASELRQIRQPRPNNFFIGIDVSQTIRPAALSDLKNSLVHRLGEFVGQKNVVYAISAFGGPGCGTEAISGIVSTISPKDTNAFTRKVKKRVERISVATRSKSFSEETPLTTPFFCFIEKKLPGLAGERVIIFSDLINDDIGCRRSFDFPEKTIEEFGKNKEGQIIFLYTTPYTGTGQGNLEWKERLLQRQRDFIKKVQDLCNEGKVRAFFYHVPEVPDKRSVFFKSQIKKCIPATMFDVIWERTCRIVESLICAVRG